MTESAALDALDALVARTWPSLFGRCLLLTGDRQRADDLARATWERVLRTRGPLDPHGDCIADLVRIATIVWRGQPAIAAGDDDSARDLAGGIDRALVRLSRLAREAVIARYVDGESPGAIAARFRCPTTQIDAWLHDAATSVHAHDR